LPNNSGRKIFLADNCYNSNSLLQVNFHAINPPRTL
jgi:hypothetical protein